MRARLLAVTALLLSLAILALAQLALLTPTAALAGGETFPVNSDGDDYDAGPDCICMTGGGVCTLRAAIEEANNCSGPQKIIFTSAMSITPTTALPAITGDGTIIDASDQWTTFGPYEVPGVVLDGNNGSFSGLAINGAHDCAIYGLQIMRFGHHGVYVYGGSTDNKVGETGLHQRNVISRNGANGVRIEDVASQRNVVKGNYVGTNPSGVAGLWDGVPDWGNAHHGVSVWDASGNKIRENLIADNGWSGATMDNVPDGQIVSNQIGMDLNGDPLPNSYYGVHLGNGALMVELYNNEIAFNARGVHVEGGSHATLLIDTIYSNTASLMTPPHGGGILVTGGSHATVRYADIYSNTADYGGGIAVENGATLDVDNSTIRQNLAQGDPGDTVAGGGVYVYQASVELLDNEVAGNSATGSSVASGGGIYLSHATSSSVIGNEVRDNVVEGNHGGGGGIYVGPDSQVMVGENVMVGNSSDTAGASGSALHINNGSTASPSIIDANWIAYNPGSAHSAVYVIASSYVTLTNNVIVRNSHDGIELKLSTSHISAINNTVAYNTGDGIVLDESDLTLYSTILAFNTEYGLRVVPDDWTVFAHRNDAWGNVMGACSESWVAWYMEEDPMFFDAGVDLYALLPGSPCMDGTDYAKAPSNSFNGLPRPQGANYDIGAYEMGFTYLPLSMKCF
jgi:parallel beta-helix repeat protein